MARKKRAPPISVRVTAAEREALNAGAKASGLSRSAYILHAVLTGKAPRAKPKASLDRTTAATLLAQSAAIADRLSALCLPWTAPPCIGSAICGLPSRMPSHARRTNCPMFFQLSRALRRGSGANGRQPMTKHQHSTAWRARPWANNRCQPARSAGLSRGGTASEPPATFILQPRACRPPFVKELPYGHPDQQVEPCWWRAAP
jgi:hypothetical protein